MESLLTYLQKRQYDLENRMLDRGVKRFREAILKNRLSDSEASTPAGQRLLIQSLEPVSEAFQAFVNFFEQRKAEGKPGRPHIAAKIFTKIGCDAAAYLTAKAILDTMSHRVTHVSVARRISSFMTDELRFRKFAEEQPKIFNWKMRKFNTTNYQHRKRSLDASIRFAKVDVSEYELTEQEQVNCGLKALEIFKDVTGYVDIVKWFGEASVSKGSKVKKHYHYVMVTPEAAEWIKQCHASMEMNSPIYMPMVEKPKRWSNLHDGGYRYAMAGRESLVRPCGVSKNIEHLESVEMPVVYDAINAIQETAWAVNVRVLDTMEIMKRHGCTDAGLPSYTDDPLPPKPEDIDTNDEARKKWRTAAHAIHEKNHARSCDATRFSKTFNTAKTMLEEIDEDGKPLPFYYPYNLDFRGRAYAIPVYLQPQGDDICRGLLVFAEGKPLGSRQAADWLAIHGANCLAESPSGEKLDKLPFEDRIKWIEQHEDMILAAADDPVTNGWWHHKGCDNPWQFLAFCFEWADFVRSGKSLDFVSHLPVAMDGSCNGLQHYSALLRDERGGRQVNLIPSEKPQDIYKTVADKVNEILQANAILPTARQAAVEGEEESRKLALDWIKWGRVNRSFVKRQVMTLPYGSERYGFRDQIKEYIKGLDDDQQPEWISDGTKGTPKYDGFRHNNYMAQIIWQALEHSVSAATEGMEFFRSLARICTKQGVPVTWTAPNGLAVKQAYRELREVRVMTTLAGSVHMPVLRVPDEEGKLNQYKQVSAIAPNVIHSLDASAMMLTVCAGKREGIESFAMIHDSFGTHAALAPRLAELTRRVFVDMYENPTLLSGIKDNMLAKVDLTEVEDVPSLPCLGTLNLTAILDSKYFFA